MAYRVVALLLLVGGMASGASLDVNSGAQLSFATLSDLSSFITLVNQTIAFEVVPGLFSLGLSGGWGWGKLDYACSFDLPTDWAIPFQPPPGVGVYHTSGPMGAAYARVSLPLFSQFSLGFELGVRLAGLGMLTAEGTPLDLDGDGQGESLDLSGFWLGLSVKLAFEL